MFETDTYFDYLLIFTTSQVPLLIVLVDLIDLWSIQLLMGSTTHNSCPFYPFTLIHVDQIYIWAGNSIVSLSIEAQLWLKHWDISYLLIYVHGILYSLSIYTGICFN